MAGSKSEAMQVGLAGGLAGGGSSSAGSERLGDWEHAAAPFQLPLHDAVHPGIKPVTCKTLAKTTVAMRCCISSVVTMIRYEGSNTMVTVMCWHGQRALKSEHGPWLIAREHELRYSISACHSTSHSLLLVPFAWFPWAKARRAEADSTNRVLRRMAVLCYVHWNLVCS